MSTKKSLNVDTKANLWLPEGDLSLTGFKIEELIKATGGMLLSGNPKLIIQGVSIDSRTIETEGLFIAIRGNQFDGHNFIQDAINKGAKAIILSRRFSIKPKTLVRNSNREVSFIAVGDTRKALGRLARFHRNRFNIPIIAVTGSNGKTTVKELIAAVLGTRFTVTKNPSSFNNEIGVPLSLLAITAEADLAVVEIGTNAPGEMAALCDIARPNRALITNIGRAHLEGFGTCEAVAKEKGALVESVGEQGTFYINIDDPFCRSIADRSRARHVTYGTGNGATWRAVRVESRVDVAKSMLTVQRLGPFTVPLIGVHNVMNALAAVAVGADSGLSREEIQEGLHKAEPPPMRMRVVRKGGRVFLNDAYNANPESMRAAIETLVSWEGARRRIAVLGDMLELGEASSSEHRELGRIAARKGVDILMVLGQFAEHVAEGAADEHLSTDAMNVCKDQGDAARLLVSLSAPGDVILVKGSRAVKMEKVLEECDRLLA